MRTIKEKKIKVKEAFNNMRLFMDIFKEKGNIYLKSESEDDLEELKQLLKSQHRSNRYVLEDLGLSFDETGVIRSLNEKIAELEKQVESKVENSPAIITQYIANMNNEVSSVIFDELGLNISVDVVIGNAMDVKINIYTVEPELTSTDKMFAKSEEDLLEKEKLHKAAFSKANQELDLESSYGKGLRVAFTENNKAKILEVLNKSFSKFGKIKDPEIDVRINRRASSEESYTITSIKFIVLASAKMQAFDEVFSQR